MAAATLSEVGKSSKPEPLATPSDLTPKQTAAIAVEVNKLVADAVVLYYKTKNFHWHMSGPHFRDYHLMLDKQSDKIFETIDPLAERVRKLGQRTVTGIDQVAKLARIHDNNKEFVPPGDMLRELLQDNKSMAANMRKAHELCDDNGDVATSSLLEIYIDETERRTWFLFEASRGLDESGH